MAKVGFSGALAVAKASITKPPKEIKLPDFWGAALAARVDDEAEMLEVWPRRDLDFSSPG